MANFDIAYKRVLADEGVTWENHPDDNGGETYAGLTRKADPSWGGWKIIDQYKKKPNFPSNLKAVQPQLLELARPFYRSKYWDKVWGDKIENQKIANDMFNTYVLTGTASIKLQNRQFGFAEKTVMDDQLLNKLNSIV